jgi:hypothetical protein
LTLNKSFSGNTIDVLVIDDGDLTRLQTLDQILRSAIDASQTGETI